MRRMVGTGIVLAALVACAPARPLALHRVRFRPSATPVARVEVTLPSTPPPPRATATAASHPAAGVPVGAPAAEAFRGLGSWIDVYDYGGDPAALTALVRGMRTRGVRTLYLETARFSDPTDFHDARSVGAALDEAKRLGLRVVAWYPPGFDDVGRDLRRSLAAVTFRSPLGHRFDAFAADIEYTEGVRDDALRSQRAVEYSHLLRARVAPGYGLGAIVVAPTSLQARPDRWPGFPWAGIARSYDVFLPMDYWTATKADPATASERTATNVHRTQSLTARPVHPIGGLADRADAAQVAAYVAAALRAGSIGGSLYDYMTTRPEVWAELRKLGA